MGTSQQQTASVSEQQLLSFPPSSRSQLEENPQKMVKELLDSVIGQREEKIWCFSILWMFDAIRTNLANVIRSFCRAFFNCWENNRHIPWKCILMIQIYDS